MGRRMVLLPVLLLFTIVLTACSQPTEMITFHVFDDVPDDVLWGHAIQTLGTKGYMSGKAEGFFDPDASLNRAEIAVLLVRAKLGPEFTPDPSPGSWCKCWIDEAVAQGLMSPVTDPLVPATRADVATLMWLMTQ